MRRERRPDQPAHQDAGAGQPLRARDLCDALDLGFEAKTVEGMHSKLKRLVKRGILAEDEPRPVHQPRP